jgi:hypothetical protein
VIDEFEACFGKKKGDAVKSPLLPSCSDNRYAFKMTTMHHIFANSWEHALTEQAAPERSTPDGRPFHRPDATQLARWGHLESVYAVEIVVKDLHAAGARYHEPQSERRFVRDCHTNRLHVRLVYLIRI